MIGLRPPATVLASFAMIALAGALFLGDLPPVVDLYRDCTGKGGGFEYLCVRTERDMDFHVIPFFTNFLIIYALIYIIRSRYISMNGIFKKLILIFSILISFFIISGISSFRVNYIFL